MELPSREFLEISFLPRTFLVKQSSKAMSSWASINRILFVSNKLPIKKEYYPIIGSNSETNSPQAAYESLVSMNIICSFLFASTDAGDFRTNIVYSSATVDSADLIEYYNPEKNLMKKP